MKAKNFPPREYLQRRLTVFEAETEMEARSAEYGVPVSPAWLERWTEFKSQMSTSDELWFWEHFPGPMTGGAGYCLVRNGMSVAFITTMRS
jgi:hypothetical protein